VARDLGISPAIAASLQQVAAETVRQPASDL
jgi:hypothetical protein